MGSRNESSFGSLRIDRGRLLQRLDDLAQVGAIEGTAGCGRLALTDADKAGRDLVVTWMRDLGLEVAIDGIGNVIAVLPGAADGPPVMCGSHIDTVLTGGRYDGNLGVLAGIEVIETVQAASFTPTRPLAVGFFTDEEGSRFQPDMLGSLVYVGGLPLEEAVEIVGVDGSVVGEELERIGYRGTMPCPGLVPHAFVELHIEQGPVLEAAGVGIGVVTGVQGISWTEIQLRGQSNHAGTTPMTMRRDAGAVATQIAVFIRELALELGAPQVATVGQLDLRPNLVNVVPSEATLTVDLRNTDENQLTKAEHLLADFVSRSAAAEEIEWSGRSLARFAPVEFDPRLVDLVERVASGAGNSVMRLPSGAGHDAQMLARVCPTAMIFVPSEGGLSHNPAEHTEPEQIEAGANVLLHTMLTLSEEEL